MAGLTVLDSGFRYDGDGALLRLGLQAHALGIAWEFDPHFGLSVSRVDPLPHQLEAVYDHLLKLARVRFLLADDAGAGKTIMAGLLIRELQLRGLAERILVVAPSNLAFQWQRELQEKFDETFVVLKGSELRAQFGVNQWMQQPKVVTSLDLAKREDVLPGLRQVHWDLVVVDEAHRMSARDESHKSQRYKLGELLRDSSDHMLLLTATPHKGDPGNFSLFLQLLDRDAYADVRSIRQAMDAGRAPFYLRRTKEAMVHFPQRDENGKWAARRIFTKRIPSTVDFKIDGSEFELYREVTEFVKRQSIRAAADGDNPRARAVGFLMALYQRRLASSTRAMRRSLGNRADRLERGLAQAEDLARTAPPDLPSMDELDEMEERDRERLERLLDAITLAGNAEMVRREITELRALAVKAENVEQAGVESKLAKFEDLLRGQGSGQGRHVEDVSAKNLGYDVTSLDTTSGDLRLIEVKGLAAATGTILLTPNERRVAEDRPDCYRLYVITNCGEAPVLQEPIANPARFPWHEVTKVQHYYLRVDAMTRPMRVRDDRPEYGAET